MLQSSEDYGSTVPTGSKVPANCVSDEYCLYADRITASHQLDWYCLATILAKIVEFQCTVADSGVSMYGCKNASELIFLSMAAVRKLTSSSYYRMSPKPLGSPIKDSLKIKKSLNNITSQLIVVLQKAFALVTSVIDIIGEQKISQSMASLLLGRLSFTQLEQRQDPQCTAE